MVSFLSVIGNERYSRWTGSIIIPKRMGCSIEEYQLRQGWNGAIPRSNACQERVLALCRSNDTVIAKPQCGGTVIH
jgi:hypothetical protein